MSAGEIRLDSLSAASPDLFPLDCDLAADRVHFVRLAEADYREESFLDGRMLPRLAGGTWVAGAEMERIARGLDGENDFIFHIGHVGSTLISRLLGESPGIFSLREPAALRTLAVSSWKTAPHGVQPRRGLLAAFLKFYARVYRPGQRSLVKATSFVSECANEILGLSPSSRAILMFVSPQAYLAAILAGPASRAELGSVSPERRARLGRRLGAADWRPEARSEGELAAMGWACEISALAAVASDFPSRVAWLDFDRFLARPKEGLAGALRHLWGEAPGAAVGAMLASPRLRQYAKAPEFPYDATARRQALERGARDHRAEIERGIAWLNTAGSAHPIIAEAARTAAAGRDQLFE